MPEDYKIIVNEGRNPVDIALGAFGSAEAVVDLMLSNQLNLDYETQAGDVLDIQAKYIRQIDRVSFFKNRNIVINTGVKYDSLVLITVDFDEVDFDETDFN
jgi:hypothetical protein